MWVCCYLASWLSGVGAAAIDNLMEDAATAEISRSQIWQWIGQDVELMRGGTVTRDVAAATIDAEYERLRSEDVPHLDQARAVFEDVAFPPDFVEFLTIPAYELLT